MCIARNEVARQQARSPADHLSKTDALDHRVSGISYLQSPALDARRSGDFYRAVFGWQLRGDPDSPSFTDGTGHVTGAWHTGIPPATNGGLLTYVYVDDVDAVLAKVTANGRDIEAEPFAEGPLWVARFRDPAGNVVGVYQRGPRRAQIPSS